MTYSAELPFQKIFLFIDQRIETLNRGKLKSFLEDKTGREVECREDFLKEKYKDDLPEKVARTKIRNKRKREFKDPLPKEIQIERKIIKKGRDLLGIIYDAERLGKTMFDLLSPEERKDHTVIITKRLIGTMEKNEARYHVRTVLNSIPSIISTSGIVEGPAKPREYYFADEGEKEDMLSFEPMEHSDQRMSRAVRSYLLQTIFWRLDGDPFCEKEGCPLYNSHWQEGVIENQIEGQLCREHEEKLSSLRKEKDFDEKSKS